MPYTVRDYNTEATLDAERLATMFNGFDSVWPGGFTRGVPETAEHIGRRMKRQERLATLIVDTGEAFAGYCDLKSETGETEVAYIPLLGAHPDHHGKGVGKMLLLEMVRRVTEKGFRELTLHTWAGNLKAVPLYKKTGFNWVPETSVFMRNFIPACLTCPAGKAFFANRDWYSVFDLEVKVAPDDVKWKGMKVFPYRFRDGDEFLNLTFDATSGGLTALETPAYSVSCSLPVEEVPAGETAPLTWEITAKGGKPLEVMLMAECDNGLDVRVLEQFTVEGERTIARDLRVALNARPANHGEKERRVRTTLIIDGQPVALETGVKVVRPVEIQYGGQAVFPGREEKIYVNLWSHLDRPLSGVLTLDAHSGLTCPQPSQSFTLPPRLKTQCEFLVTANEAGVFATNLHFEAEGVTGSRPVVFRALAGSGATAHIESDYAEQAVLENSGLLLSLYTRGGWLDMFSKSLERSLGGMPMPEFGPPFVSWREKPQPFTTRIETRGGETCLTQTAPSQEFPGLVLERSLFLMNGDLARVEHRVSNTANAPQKTQLQIRTFSQIRKATVIPYTDGILREPTMDWENFPSGDTDVVTPDRQPAENWLAGENDEAVYGLVWQGTPEVQTSWGINLNYDLGELPANSIHCLPPLYLVGGAGNWETVRGWWRRLVQPSGTHEAQKPEPYRVLEVAFAPSPALLTGQSAEATLTVKNHRGKPLNAELKLTGDMFRSEPSEFALDGVNWQKPTAFPVYLSAPETPSAGFLKATLSDTTAAREFKVPAIRVSAGSELRVSSRENGEFEIANGLLPLQVAPRFMGSVTSLESGGVNHILSAYPTSRPFVWANPWFGGIHPFIGWMGDHRLPREKFTGEAIERAGERGLEWQGVRVKCQPEHKDLRWLGIEAEYLTLPGSNIVALVTRWTNQSAAKMQTPGSGGIVAWSQPGGTRENVIAHWKNKEEQRFRRRGGFPIDAQSDSWSAVENPVSRDALLMVATDPHAHALVEDVGDEGPHLATAGAIAHEPNETREILSWLVLTRDLAQADAYAALAKVRVLP